MLNPAEIKARANSSIPRGYDPELYRLRHSAAHVMAEAVVTLFGSETQIAIGPPTDEGFYYDFVTPRPITADDLPQIEAQMREIVRGDHSFNCREVSADEARVLFAGQPFKLELIDNLAASDAADSAITVYTQHTFTDLCRGPHVDTTAALNPDAIRLLTIAGAYWRGDENQPMLQRIYGTAWRTKDELDAFLWRMEEAAKRDHRRIGQQLDLFSMSEDVGPGLILWHPKGGLVRKLIEDFWGDEHERSGYDFVYTPHIGKASLWQTSGHLDFYKENMYAPLDIDGQAYYLKPMNCPFHMHIYTAQQRSYRDLPLRFSEKGTVYRYERSGVLHGLLRVRGFTQDDAHHFCRPDQVDAEIDFTLDFCLRMLRAFGFEDVQAYLSTRPAESVGESADWETAEVALEAALQRAGLAYEVDPGGGAFYGPKIDIKVKDALNREWQLSTIQFDFNLPVRFDISYIGEDGKPHRPYMVHRALLGSIERFFGVLVEHYAGAFPVWLAPVQATLIPIADRHVDYARQVAARLAQAGVRAEVDDSSSRMNNKIRRAQEQKVPYMLVIGDREIEADSVALRLRTGEDAGATQVDALVTRIQAVVAARAGI